MGLLTVATPKDRPPRKPPRPEPGRPEPTRPRLLEHRRPGGTWPDGRPNDRAGDRPDDRPIRRDLVVEDAPPAQARPARPRERQIAVALKHEMGGPGAPRVVATGWGETARKILETAFANNVKVREDPDLAKVLAAVELDTEIPLEAFSAVAEILAYVYQANGKLPPQGGGAAS